LAKRFGGPGTDFWNLVSRGPRYAPRTVERRDLGTGRHARHESVGQRDEKPAVLVTSATSAIVTTPMATVRAAASLTGLGKEKNRFIHNLIDNVVNSLRRDGQSDRGDRPTTMMTIRTTLGEDAGSAWPEHRPPTCNEEHVDGVDDQVARTTISAPRSC